MTCIKKFLRRGRVSVLILPALLAGGLLLVGCENDTVAPHDEVPVLNEGEVASQAGWVSMAAAIVGPQTIEFANKTDKTSYQHVFAGVVVGTVHLDYYLGGPDGTSATWNEGDYVELYTAAEEPLVITVGLSSSPGTVLLAFDIAADIDRDATPDTATINGGGAFTSGPYGAAFEFDNLVVTHGVRYPAAGTMTLSGSGFTLTVTFDGDHTAILTSSDGATYIIDLDNGDTTPVDEMLLPE